jgi:hypothetical protein
LGKGNFDYPTTTVADYVTIYARRFPSSLMRGVFRTILKAEREGVLRLRL